MSDNTRLIGASAKKHELVVWSDPFKTICAGFAQGTFKKVAFDEIMEKGMFKFLCSPILVICRGLNQRVESVV